MVSACVKKYTVSFVYAIIVTMNISGIAVLCTACVPHENPCVSHEVFKAKAALVCLEWNRCSVSPGDIADLQQAQERFPKCFENRQESLPIE